MRKLLFLLLLACSTASAATYYIDFVGGSDANNGTSKITAWKRQPYMVGFSGTYAHSAGDVFVFKGGVTWTHAVYPVCITTGGSAGNIDTYTVDAAWFTGGSWTRPVFDLENTNVSAQAVCAGINFSSAFIVSGASYVTFNNLEIKNQLSGQTLEGLVSILAAADHVTVQNSFLHGWNTTTTCDTNHGGIVGSSAGSNNVFNNNILSNTEFSATKQNGSGFKVDGNVTNNTIHDIAIALDFGGYAVVSGNTIYNIDYPVGDYDRQVGTSCLAANQIHTNVIVPLNASSVFNNVIHDIGVNGFTISPHPCWSSLANTNSLIYNNLIYGNDSTNAIQPDPSHCNNSTIKGNIYVFDNTFAADASSNALYIVSRDPDTLSILKFQDNHLITDSLTSPAVFINGSFGAGLVATPTIANNLQRTHTQATSDGYTSAETNPFSPPTSTSITINAGVNILADCSGCNLDLLGVTRPQNTTWFDVGAYEFLQSPPVFKTGIRGVTIKGAKIK